MRMFNFLSFLICLQQTKELYYDIDVTACDSKHYRVAAVNQFGTGVDGFTSSLQRLSKVYLQLLNVLCRTAAVVSAYFLKTNPSCWML